MSNCYKRRKRSHQFRAGVKQLAPNCCVWTQISSEYWVTACCVLCSWRRLVVEGSERSTRLWICWRRRTWLWRWNRLSSPNRCWRWRWQCWRNCRVRTIYIHTHTHHIKEQICVCVCVCANRYHSAHSFSLSQVRTTCVSSSAVGEMTSSTMWSCSFR